MRARLLLRYLLLLSIAAIASVSIVRQIVVARVDERIQKSLNQEVEELRRFADGIDPQTGKPFGDRIQRIFTEFLRSDVPGPSEASLTFINGQPYQRTRGVTPYRLDQDPALVERWSELEEPDRGTVDTPAGPVDYLGVPLENVDGASGVFVIAVFRDLETREVQQVTLGAAGVGLIVLIIGSVLAWRVAHKALVPVESVTTTAQAITETDLSRRIEVKGQDEISRLAHTFNDMLDRLEAAFDAQKSFINDAGHELRTPITIVTGHLEVLDDDPEERAQTVALLLDELDRMGRMVNDLLVLTKADRPDFLSLQTVDVEALTNELRFKMEALANRRWELDEVGKGVVVGDRQRLTQALMQLAQNAVEHTNDDDVIALGSLVDGRVARFWVRDTGPGIAPQDHERIFGRFTRGSAARQSEGVGLGLAIVKAIAEAHRGGVLLDSERGRGATFTIEIPLDPPSVKTGAGAE
ncbi:MAG: sensor histidine kinase [Actinomycetota bacterium]